MTVDGRPAAFRRVGQELRITPARALRRAPAVPGHGPVRRGADEVITDPDGSIEGFVPTDDGAFVVGEPQGAPGWFPANDTPTDKATYTVRMNVPAGLTAVGNGRLVSQRTAGGRSTFVWHESRPMASYLATITLGRFQVHRTTAGRIPVYVALDPREAAEAKPVTDRIPEIIAWEQSVFGPYPFETVGAIVDRAPDVGYALESADQAQLRLGAETSPRSCTSWPTSGTATRSRSPSGRTSGSTRASPRTRSGCGRSTPAATPCTPQQRFDALYKTPASDEDLWTPPPGNPGGPDAIFGAPSYDRGAMTLQVLRNRIGDRAFFTILKAWAAQHRYGNATTAQFVALAERVSHRDLDGLFRTWLYTAGKPGFTR